MTNFEIFINISIVVSLLFTILPIIECFIDILGFMTIWLFKKILKLSLTAYMSLVGFVWGMIIFSILKNIFIQSINNKFVWGSINLHDITHTAIENIFNHSVNFITNK